MERHRLYRACSYGASYSKPTREPTPFACANITKRAACVADSLKGACAWDGAKCVDFTPTLFPTRKFYRISTEFFVQQCQDKNSVQL